jgi:hypothetical protein
MSITLKRKMFKMGGKVDAHGVGITSGLEKRTGMNQGGRVDRGIVGYQPKNHPARQGNREGHAGYTTFYNTIGLPAAKALLNMFKKRSLEPAKQFINAPIKSKALDTGRMIDKYIKSSSTAPGTLRKLYRGAQLAAPVGIAGGAGGAGLGLAMAGLDRAGLLEEGNDDNFAEATARTIGKAGLMASIPGIATALTGAAFDTDKNPKRKMLYDILAGNQLAEEEEEETQDLDIKSVAEREAEAYEDMKTEASRKAEMMYEMLNGGVNKMAAISQGLAAATPYIANEQYAEGAAAFTQGLQPELQKDEQLRQTIGAQVLGDMASEKASQDQIVNTLLGSGDALTALEFTRLQKARDEIGLENIQLAPIKDGEIDVNKPGIYVDKDNASGKLYIAVNESLEVKLTDDANEAADFVKTTA